MTLILLLVLFYSGLMIYISPPTVTIGDTAELTAAAATLGIAHSPGYPLFCNLYKIFTTIFPFGDFGYRAAIGSVILFILTTIIFCLLVKRISNNNFFIVLFAVTFLLSQDVLLRQSVIGEVFALHNLIYVVILYIMFNKNLSYKKRIYLVGLLLGLSFGNQHISIFYVPSILLCFTYEAYKNKYNVSIKLKDMFLAILFFILGMAIYFYIPIRSIKQPLYDWEDPQTIDRFLYLFTRARYGTFSLAQGGKISISFGQLYSATKFYVHILGTKNVILLIICILLWLIRINNLDNFIYGTVLIINIFLTGVFLIAISGLKSITPNNLFILERLITVSILSAVIFVTTFLSQIFKNKIILGFVIILNCMDIARNLAYADQRKNFFLYDYTINIFRNLPYNSILLSDRADETEFCIAYYQRLLNKRNDIQFIDCNASVTRSIYGDNYYKIWGKPRLEIRNKVEKTIVESSSSPVVYNTVLPDQTLIKKYKFGLLHITTVTSIVLPNEIFIIRNIPDETIPREFGLYITYLELLAQYYFERSLSEKKFFDIAKNYFIRLFLEVKDPRYLNYLAYYYFVNNELTSSITVYNKILNYVTESTTYAETLVNLGVVYEKMGQLQQAEGCYQQAIKIKQDYKLAYYNLGNLYLKLGRKDDAIKNFKIYLKLTPDDKRVEEFLKQIIQKT